MSNDLVRARAAHPSQVSNFPKWQRELDDSFDVHSDEAIALTRSVPRREYRPEPRGAHPVYDTVFAALLGCLVGLVLGIALFVLEGGAA